MSKVEQQEPTILKWEWRIVCDIVFCLARLEMPNASQMAYLRSMSGKWLRDAIIALARELPDEPREDNENL